MDWNRIKRLLSYPLLVGGAILLFFGAREILEPVLAQRAAAREFTYSPASEVHAAGTALPVPESMPVLHLGDTVGKLSIPRLGTVLYVVEGDDNKDLRMGPGHVHGSDLPGGPGNCVIAGHRDTQFRVLKDVRKGDDIVLETKSGQYVYRVSGTEIVSPRNTTPLKPTRQAELNLITCYPFYFVGSAPDRFVVQARLTAAIPAAARTGVVE